jgi:hypothetical protein
MNMEKEKLALKKNKSSAVSGQGYLFGFIDNINTNFTINYRNLNNINVLISTTKELICLNLSEKLPNTFLIFLKNYPHLFR